MANHKSAKKRARQDVVRRDRNRKYLSSVRTAVKTLKSVISGEKEGDVNALFTKAQSALAKAGSKGLLKSNNASRKISRLSAAITKSTKEEAPKAAAAKKKTTKKKSTAKKKTASKNKTTKK